MVNPWVEFVRQFSKDNNISYGCAISEAGPAYRAMKQGAQTPKAPPKKRITIKPKNEKPKKVEPPKTDIRKKYFEGLDKTDKEDRKRYKDYRRIKCDKNEFNSDY